MNITQRLGKLIVVADVDIVIAPLPEALCFPDQAARDALLERFDRDGERVSVRLAHQEMDMFGHDDVSEHPQAISAPDAFERGDKGTSRIQ